ncbi:MAG TPA: trypsin-like peptidase domain-containing protein [Dictyobacter sp.]|jgi:S1-C subfamily serine protease|nr:trypsin-like peptidase domain-containing protein [Dictyobacter sp.]
MHDRQHNHDAYQNSEIPVKHPLRDEKPEPGEPVENPAPVVHKKAKLRMGTLILLGFLGIILFGAGLFTGWQYGNQGGGLQSSEQSMLFTSSENAVEALREQVIGKVQPTVVQINVLNDQGNDLGSGVIIDKKGYIVTNYHVVAGSQQIQVVLFDGTTLSAKLIGTAPADDLAVIQVTPPKTGLYVAKMGDSADLQVGQDVLAIGNPLGITQTVTNGIVSALGRNVATGSNGQILANTIQTDAAINPGNSGGALVDLHGHLVGIPTLTAIDPQFKTPANGVGFAIPVNRVKFIVPQLISYGTVKNTGRAALREQVTDFDAIVAQKTQVPVQQGVLVVGITPADAVAQNGLKVGDVIVKMNNTSIANMLTLNDALLQQMPGERVLLQVYRGKQLLTLSVTLGELSA